MIVRAALVLAIALPALADTPAKVFAAGSLRAALTRERTGIATKNLLDRMLHPAVKVGTSTPI